MRTSPSESQGKYDRLSVSMNSNWGFVTLLIPVAVVKGPHSWHTYRLLGLLVRVKSMNWRFGEIPFGARAKLYGTQIYGQTAFKCLCSIVHRSHLLWVSLANHYSSPIYNINQPKMTFLTLSLYERVHSFVSALLRLLLLAHFLSGQLDLRFCCIKRLGR